MAELKPVLRGDRWRIQMSWPDYNARFFGDFDSEAEVDEVIEKEQTVRLHGVLARSIMHLVPEAGHMVHYAEPRMVSRTTADL